MYSSPTIDKIHLSHKSRQTTTQRYDVSTQLTTEKQALVCSLWQEVQHQEPETLPVLLQTLQACGTVALPAAVHEGTPLGLHTSAAVLKAQQLHVAGALGFPHPASRGEVLSKEMPMEAFEAWVTAQLGILYAFFKIHQLELQSVRCDGVLYQAFYQPELFPYLDALKQVLHRFDPWLHWVVPYSQGSDYLQSTQGTCPPLLIELPIGYRVGSSFEPLAKHPLTPEQTKQQLEGLLLRKQLTTLDGQTLTLPSHVSLHGVYVAPQHPQWADVLTVATKVVPKVLPATVVASSHSGWLS
ncbi:MAG: LamB/YcsF family protein [Vampirovibrionales bacterium]